jgi:hypothetical protein
LFSPGHERIAIAPAIIPCVYPNNGIVDTRVLVYDVGEQPTPSAPMAHYVLQLRDSRPKNRPLGASDLFDAGVTLANTHVPNA